MTIKDLQKQIVKFRDDRDWKSYHNPKDITLSLVAEVGELVEHFLWRTNDEIDQFKKHKDFKNLKEEVCDVMLNTLLLAHELDMDLEKEFLEKLEKNKKKYPIGQPRWKKYKSFKK